LSRNPRQSGPKSKRADCAPMDVPLTVPIGSSAKASGGQAPGMNSQGRIGIADEKTKPGQDGCHRPHCQLRAGDSGGLHPRGSASSWRPGAAESIGLGPVEWSAADPIPLSRRRPEWGGNPLTFICFPPPPLQLGSGSYAKFSETTYGGPRVCRKKSPENGSDLRDEQAR